MLQSIVCTAKVILSWDRSVQVYNLCEEAVYDPENFHGRVEWIPFDDNHVPPLHLIKIFCESVQQWLDDDPANVAVIHCRVSVPKSFPH